MHQEKDGWGPLLITNTKKLKMRLVKRDLDSKKTRGGAGELEGPWETAFEGAGVASSGKRKRMPCY